MPFPCLIAFSTFKVIRKYWIDIWKPAAQVSSVGMFFCQMKAMQGVKMSFKLQELLQQDPTAPIRGMREDEHTTALNNYIYSLIRSNRAQRRAMLSSMLNMFDDTAVRGCLLDIHSKCFAAPNTVSISRLVSGLSESTLTSRIQVVSVFESIPCLLLLPIAVIIAIHVLLLTTLTSGPNFCMIVAENAAPANNRR